MSYEEVKFSQKMRIIPLGREEESSSIYTLLKNAIKNKEYGILYVSGMPGCGKTLTCINVVQVIKEKYTSVNVVEINCGSLILPSDVFVEIHKRFDSEVAHSTPRILERVLQKQTYTILLIDEVDMLITKNQNILYALLELPSLCKNLYVIAISNTYNLPDYKLTAKVRSRLGWNRINFPIYKKTQIIGILKEHKTKVSFTQEALEFCANKICTLNGDVRKAFQIQKHAVEQSQKSHISTVGLEEMDKAIKYVFHSMQGSFIRSLSEYQKIILYTVSQKGSSLPDALFSNFKTALSLRNYPNISFKEFQVLLTKLHELGILKGRVNTTLIETDYIPDELDVIFQEEENDDLQIISST